jgi:hypothetical protein
MQVQIVIAGQELQMFHPLLREGVEVRVGLGKTVYQVLEEDLHVPEEIIEQDIQSLFLDNHPVDDLQTRIHSSESVLTLSAAMPGLVGACMRRGGVYAGLREGISWTDEKKDQNSPKEGCIRMKLFNFMAPRIGPILLSHGVQVGGKRLAQALRGLSAVEQERIRSVRVDEEDVEVDNPQILEKLAAQGFVWLQVVTEN